MSYRGTLGIERAPGFLATDALLVSFGSDRQQAASAYRRFVAEGLEVTSPWNELKNQVYLGSDGSVARMQALIDPNRPLREVPLKQRRSVAKPLKYFSTQYLNRDEAIAAAYGTGAYTMQSIADYLDIGRMTG